jgi:hypothetical protein
LPVLKQIEAVREAHENPTKYIGQFWWGTDSQELSMDATMLRTAQWGNIRGYEPWFRALENQLREAAFGGGINPFALFNYCRADIAIRDMKNTLQLLLAAAEALSFGSTPWRRNDESLGCATHEAASLAFASLRTGTPDINGIIERALDDLRQSFDHKSGAWPAFSRQPNRLSVESTAMAIHAFREASVEDFDQFSGPAKEWLWSQQTSDGCWFERAAPDPVWLTVLTLDALELASGGRTVTFGSEIAESKLPLVFVAYQHKDTSWCSETAKLDRFWLEFSAVIPWLGGAESDEGIEVFGRPEGVHSQTGR